MRGLITIKGDLQITSSCVDIFLVDNPFPDQAISIAWVGSISAAPSGLAFLPEKIAFRG